MFFKYFKTNASTRNQYVSALIVNLITLSHGCAIGWLSPFLPYLLSSDSHLMGGAITVEEASWVGSLLCIGGMIGTIFYGYLNERIGKKYSLLLLVPPHLMFWITIFFSTKVYHLYFARVCAGFTGGGTLRTISLFTAEISENNIRGALGSFLVLFLNFGILLSFIAGTYFNFFTMPLVMIVIPLMYTLLVTFLPDTPHSLIKRNKIDEAMSSLIFYRTSRKIDKQPSESVRLEFDILKRSLESQQAQQNLQLSDFTNEKARNGLLIGFFLMWLNQFSGCFALMNYTANVFKESGSSLSPNESSVVVAFIQLLGSYCASFLVDKCGRKILMIISTSLTSFGYCAVATYSYLNHVGLDVTNLRWIPVISLSLVIFVASLGILTLPFVILPEVIPQNIRSAASTICVTSVTFNAFIVIKIYPILLQHFAIHGTMWIFSIICIFGTCVVIGFLPETKGKNLVSPS